MVRFPSISDVPSDENRDDACGGGAEYGQSQQQDPKQHLPQLNKTATTPVDDLHSQEVSLTGGKATSMNNDSAFVFKQEAEGVTTKKDGKLKRLMASLQGNNKTKPTEKVRSSSSSTSSLSSGGHPKKRRQKGLPGFGFVATTTSTAVEGNYRAALEALDLASSRTLHTRGASNKTFSSQEKDDRYPDQQLQALCLQSKKQMDCLDIEMVAVQVDSDHHYLLGSEFLLEDDSFTGDIHANRGACVDRQKVVLDLSQAHPGLHLSHVCCEGTEALELELDEAARILQREVGSACSGSNGEGRHGQFLVFKTRFSLELEIERTERTVRSAEQSDDPEVIQRGIEARGRLAMLLPLRKVHMSRQELEEKIKKLTREVQLLDSSDLCRRYELVSEKAHLTSQLLEETVEEEQWKSRCVPTLSVEGSLDMLHPPLASPAVHGAALSITIFQSAPLAYVDPATGLHHVCPLLDFGYEQRALSQSLQDAGTKGPKIRMEYEVATTDRLSAFLAKKESRVMHLSCHGHPKYLALENGFGGMHILTVRDLKRFIGAGAGNLGLVFVSACHSKAAGNAFIDAGIRHVICCRQDDKFRDEGAIEFSKSFYRALALNNTIKDAFNLAREAMRVSPMVQNSKAEYDKFVLLPEVSDDDPHHDVYVFANSDELARAKLDGCSQRKARVLPRVPQCFIGREMDMYTLLEALRSNDIVQIAGSSEIGKATLVAATTQYIAQRQKSFLFDDILWLPVQEEAIDMEDCLYRDLSHIVDIIMKSSDTPCQLQRDYALCWGRTVRSIQNKRLLLVIQWKKNAFRSARRNMEYFLRDLMRHCPAKVITVGVPVLPGSLDATVFNIEALDYDSTVLLFARLYRSSSISSQEIVSALSTLSNSKGDHSSAAGRRQRIFEQLGAGIPSAIRSAAMEISEESLKELFRLAERPFVNVSSRAELELKLKELFQDRAKQVAERNFLLARETEQTIEELSALKLDFPILDDLCNQQSELNQSLETAIASKQYDSANQIQVRLAALANQISKEREATTRSAQVKPQDV